MVSLFIGFDESDGKEVENSKEKDETNDKEDRELDCLVFRQLVRFFLPLSVGRLPERTNYSLPLSLSPLIIYSMTKIINNLSSFFPPNRISRGEK